MAIDLRTDPKVLVLGGARSGKSRFAETLAEAADGLLVYIATAEAHDDEMRERIFEHHSRRNQRWTTVDTPIRLPDAIFAHAAEDTIVLVDCLTLWLTNLMLGDHDVAAASAEFAQALDSPHHIVLVSNEVGLGIVPENALARRFRDLSGRLNQEVASLCDAVVFTAAGLPLILKSSDTGA